MAFKDIDIFVFAHRDFEIAPENPCYKLVTIEDFKTDIPLDRIMCNVEEDPLLLMEHGYSEGARLHYVWQHVPVKRYVGISHYRRYFDFFDDIPDMDVIFKDHDAILPKFNLGWPSVGIQYTACHCGDDLSVVMDVIRDLYPEYYNTAVEALNSEKFYPCNMFVLTRAMFDEYCSFMYGVLGEYDRRMGFRTDTDILAHVESNKLKYTSSKPSWSQNAKIEYQTRIQAFLMERISTIFFSHRVKNPYMTDMILTELHEEYEREYYNYCDPRKK